MVLSGRMAYHYAIAGNTQRRGALDLVLLWATWSPRPDIPFAPPSSFAIFPGTVDGGWIMTVPVLNR